MPRKINPRIYEKDKEFKGMGFRFKNNEGYILPKDHFIVYLADNGNWVNITMVVGKEVEGLQMIDSDKFIKWLKNNLAKVKAFDSKPTEKGMYDIVEKLHHLQFEDYRRKHNLNVNASANSKQFSYKGQIITANSKQEAIQQIVATKRFKKGDKVGVSIKILYDSTKKHKTDFGYTIDTSEKGYYDLRDKFGNIVCMDGEECTVKTISKLGDITFTNNDGEKETSFTLSKKEVDTCVG